MAHWIGAFFVAAITVAAITFYLLKGDFFRKEQSPAAVVHDSTKAQDSANKLKLEIPKTVTPAPEFELRTRRENS